MAVIHIEWLSDEADCDDCGPSYADGAKVTIDVDTPIKLDLSPIAHCCGHTHHERHEVLLEILKALGHTVEES